jgi:transcriptional regulator with XRE-family HTH domain
MEKGTDKTRKPHQGRNVTRLREIRDMKQETLASLLGLTQQAVSKIEQSETIDDERLEEIAKILDFSPEVIKKYSDESLFTYIENMHLSDNASANNYYCTFNVAEENRKLNEENRRLYEENKKLYEALLKEKDEKIALLQKFIDKK